MKNSLLAVSSLVFFLQINLKAQVNIKDSMALVDLYDSCHTVYFNLEYNSWFSGPVSIWKGITLENNRVTGIDIQGRHLNGIRKDALTGTVPNSFANLTELKSIYFQVDDFNEQIPSVFQNLPSLTSLQLKFDKIKGQIPYWLVNLKNLEVLSLVSNDISGRIPSFLFKMKKLSELVLSENELAGTIPADISRTDSLSELDLSYNKLTGEIPRSFYALSQLVYFSLQNNNFEGRISPDILKLTKLQGFSIAGNHFNSIPKTSKAAEFFAALVYVFFINSNDLNFDGIQQFVSMLQGHSLIYEYFPQNNIILNYNNSLLSVTAGGTLANDTFYWYRNGSLYKKIAGDSTLSVTENGKYFVNVKNTIATLLTLQSDTITISDLKLTFKDQPKTNSINASYIYPNPVSDILNINVNITQTSNFSVEIINAGARVVLFKQMLMQQGFSTQAINVSSLPAGNYFVRIILGNQNQTLNFIKAE